VNTWDLDADLVVLSACESGLGRYAGGEGYVGFAQALFVKGARSVLLSQWKVSDRATSLLMERFYQNLLGKRPGPSAPLPKAEALREAKEWLGRLSDGDLADVERGAVQKLPGKPVEAPRATAAGRYAHPYYWAGFILVGDPN
jgi:CHAT domain-containing protein